MTLICRLSVALSVLCHLTLTVNATNLQNVRPQPTVDTLKAYQQLVEADSLKNKGKYNQAIMMAQKAQHLYRLAGYPERVLYCLVRRARIQDAAGQPEQRLLTLRQAQAYTAGPLTITFKGLKADTDMQFAEVYIAMGRLDSVEYYCNRAAAVFLALKQWQQLAYCDVLRAVQEYYAKNFESMESRLASALRIARQKLPVTNEVYSVIYQLQGVLYDAIGDYEKAIVTAQNSLQAKLTNPRITSLDSSIIVSLYNNIGAIYYEKRDFDRTIDYYNQALRLALPLKSIPAATLLSIHQNTALAYQKQGKADLAMRNYMRSLDYRNGATPQKIAAIYFSLCAHYIEQKNNTLALQYLQKGKVLQGNSQQGIELYYLQKANYQLLLNQPQKAIVTYQAGLQASVLNKDVPLTTAMRQKLGATYLAQGNVQQALHQVEQGLKGTYAVGPNRSVNTLRLNQVGDRISLVELLRLKSEIFQQLARSSATSPGRQQQLQSAHRLNQTISTLLDTLRISYPWENAKYSLIQKANPFYKTAMEVALQLHQLTGKDAYLNDAFGYAEKNRAAILLETMMDTRARQNVSIPDKVWDNEKRLRINLTFYTGKLLEATAANDSSRMIRYQQYLFENRRKLEALTTDFQKTYPTYYQVRHSTKPASLQTIQAKLTANQATFIEYAEGAGDLYAFCITPTSKRVVRLGKIDAIDRQVDRLRTSLTDYSLVAESSTSAYKLFTQSAQQLYKSLIKQVFPGQDSFPKRLIVVPTGSLSYVPFDNLLDSLPNHAGLSSYTHLPYLLRKTTISYAYSATLFANESSRKASIPANTLLAFAPTYSAVSQPGSVTSVHRARAIVSTETPLTETQREVKQIARHFKGQTYLDDAATKRQFLQLAENYDLIHVAMHSTVNQQNPNLNALVFTREKQRVDNRLAAYEVASLQLNARMTVLSGCETGYGTYQAGEGVLSLARSFMLAGSQSVVMSLWKAEDRASAAIMDLFYKGLAAGLPKDEALRQAKLTYIDQSDELTGHPMFWSGIVVIGDGSPLVKLTNQRWLVLVLLLALLAGLLWWQKKSISKVYTTRKLQLQ